MSACSLRSFFNSYLNWSGFVGFLLLVAEIHFVRNKQKDKRKNLYKLCQQLEGICYRYKDLTACEMHFSLILQIVEFITYTHDIVITYTQQTN